ncbi:MULTISPECIES: hypothetical protein [unclassified Ruegeria]|uniref:hypothetical protein n=1 Tax=unclassified Ruegeria TaxID=2625375 RepID=UPI0014922D46|nr:MULTISPECIES: hypothetical protein [unclassified Ruegeria]NOD90550.1 hypothetical protein [Ruegeria sp. HKCCD4318]NOD94871.1 hypothetical protein [Ruegeria sp. HKCCD4884]NOE15947.1 hypothetical protein [Ruegeria sp. HKCCD4318-2]
METEDYPVTWELSDELPELSDALSGRIETDALLSEAIADLKKVTALLDDTSITAPERAEWAHIRSELVNELRRMVKRNLRNTFN